MLVVAGVLGVGRVVSTHPALLTGVRWLGAAYLVGYGLTCLRTSHHHTALTTADEPRAMRGVLSTVFALTWLNPHVYLDTVLLIGSLANQHQGSGRWWFAAGAVVTSMLWFTALGYGAQLLAPLFSIPPTWQVLDVAIALEVFAIAAVLVLT